MGRNRMANNRKFAFIAVFIAVCWIAWGTLVGIFAALAHLLKSTTSVISLFLAVIYSCLFGVLGWQVYKWRGRRDGWPSAKRGNRRRARLQDKKEDTPEETEDAESGWK
jgi:hypothetical protein